MDYHASGSLVRISEDDNCLLPVMLKRKGTSQ